MVKRQRVLAAFGEFAIGSESLDEVLMEACRLVGEATDTGRAKVLEIQGCRQELLVRAGVGWAPDVVGTLRLRMSDRSPETYAVRAARPVVSQDVTKDDRFEIPQFMKQAGVIALVNVPILVPGQRPYGILQVDDTKPRAFGDDEIEFLRTYAMILGPVIDRLHLVEARAKDQEQLMADEARYGLLIGSWAQAEWETDANGVVVADSPSWRAYTGQTLEEWLGYGWLDAIHPDDRVYAEEQWQRGVAARRLIDSELRLRASDGGWRWTNVRAVPVLGVGGHIEKWAGMNIDIDARKRAEAALRESEARLSQFGEASQDVLWIRNANTLTWEYLSPGFEAIYGMRCDDALRGDNFLNWAALIVDEDRERAVASIGRVRRGETLTFEYRVRRPVDGQVRWLRDNDFPMLGPHGDVERIGGVGQDVTELKRIEEALQDSEGRLRVLMEGVPQLIWRSGNDGLWTWASPQWLDYTGQTQEESHGWGWLDAIHSDSHAAAEQAWSEANSHGRVEVEYRIRRVTDGAWRWHQSRSVPVRAAAGADGTEGIILEWLGTMTDIEDLKRLQGQQQVMVAELQHRTRNLLGVVRNVAQRSIEPSAGRDEYDARLAALGRVQGFLSRSPFYMVPLAELVTAELKAVGNEPSSKLLVSGPPVELPGEGVQTIALALHELVTNAVKYGAIAQVRGQLSVTWHVQAGDAPGGERLVIEWRESGVTMPRGPPSRRGYGSELITKALPYQLNAETLIEFKDDGVYCRIALPGSAFSVVSAG